MTATTPEQVTLPPRPLIRTFWMLHRAIVRLTGGRFGLKRPTHGATFGMLRLHTVGRRSGQARIAMIGYYEDGQNLVTLAMNGWGDADPAWWLNLQAHPIAVVDLPDGRREVRARAAAGEERDRLWATFRDYPGWGEDLGALSARRPGETAIVVLEPQPDGYALAERRRGHDSGHEHPADRAASALRATPAESRPKRRLRPRYLWIVPALAIEFYASGEAEHLRVGILPLLVFGIVPDLPRLLALGQPHAHGHMAARAVPSYNLLHHPLPPIALLAFTATGVISPVLYVGALAWLGHIVFGLGIGDRLRRRDGSLPPLWSISRQRVIRDASAPPAESAA